MIVDVNNLDLAALRCYIFYNASTIALSEEYGFSCNIEEYEQNMEDGLRFLFLAENCAANLTNSTFCQIQEFIDDAIHSGIYKLRLEEDCAEGALASICTLLITDNVTSCSGGLTINILQ